ncbi:DUF3509 domain-containing protein [Aquipseudomonas ullengensis]|uniref:DUF3509 domain-containing protein n=1 Tax=Aquipseudomonas ullengensis TaxID=2759166 RepID=A0A7W4LHZ2_9GAMM|nr:DUF3509 domain-containing protein [Pseudomonas ullengensis]MBB2493524.1 DUF3509 domain-containing protein [Pseudomonas ullengensis]
MNNLNQELSTEFSDYQVAIKPRPDGKLLLTLHRGGELVVNRAIEREAMQSKACLHSAIRELVRDIKLEAGEVTCQGDTSQWLYRELPTFTGAPICQTVAKTLVRRRKLELCGAR